MSHHTTVVNVAVMAARRVLSISVGQWFQATPGPTGSRLATFVAVNASAIAWRVRWGAQRAQYKAVGTQADNTAKLAQFRQSNSGTTANTTYRASMLSTNKIIRKKSTKLKVRSK